ncbi:histidine phosphatase family protein [Pengzhenrongella sicca]|uniref:Histidine phosphatase family protein n=1 Tax=Pengzhenrongella sicca TaxID=2819238 RepID=A0A8A4Z9R0_9MICO|nr:histidine phosphatase family protein [Pengzhenrongella sicca]QTE28632.1 histidine phosphatase family protein [Pengzhenrongella sicca]
MSAGTLLLWRHGRTAHNATLRLQGQVDIPLDDIGARQARTAAAALVATTKPGAIVVSDLSRAVATAGFLAEITDQPLVVDPRLRERSFGLWEGLTGDEISARWADEFAVWRAGGEPENVGAETRAAVASRMVEAITEHADRLEADDALVVVSHGAAITLAITALLGLDTVGWRGIAGLTNAHWTELRRNTEKVSPGWRLFGHDLGPSTSIEQWNAGTDLT